MSGTAVRNRRLELRMTQVDLADRSGFALSFIKYVEKGRSQPNDINGLRLADALACDIATIAAPRPQAEGSAA